MNTAVEPSWGLLLVVHGTRDEQGIGEAHRALGMVRARLAPRPVELGFIELAEPSIGEAVDRLLSQRVRRITVAPLMLFAAAHVKQDIPRLVTAALGEAEVDVCYADPLGSHPSVLAVSADRMAAAIDPRNLNDAVLLLVGRGGGDAEAIQAFEQFARRRGRMTPAAQTRVCYLAVASPSFEEAVVELSSAPQRQIVVEPHLLFHGRLMQQIKERVERCQRENVGQNWLLCQHLGPDERIIDAFVERVSAAERRVSGTSGS